MFRCLRGPLISLSTLLLAAVIGEIYFRLDARTNEAECLGARQNHIWQQSHDPELIYVHRPNYFKNGVRKTDSHGLLQAQEATFEKPRDKKRILFFGDSLGAGPDLPEDWRFSAQLKQRIGYEVLNFCINGYKTQQEARLLETAGAPFQGDLILVEYCLNDPGNSGTPCRWFYEPGRASSYLWEFLYRKLGPPPSTAHPLYSQYVPTGNPGEDNEKYWFPLYQKDSDSWHTVEDGFQRIAAVARQRQVPAVLVIFPLLLPPDWQVERVKPYHQQVREAAEAVGVHVIDLLPEFSREHLTDMRGGAGDRFHFSPRGLSFAAGAVARGLKSLELAP